jgi:ADP-heptose:LPS heptosyltransferase
MYLKSGVLTSGPLPSTLHAIHKRKTKRTFQRASKKRITHPIKLDDPNKYVDICIQRTLPGLGDILMATPIARGVKRKWPNSYLVFSVDTLYANGDLAALLENNPYIDSIVDFRHVNRADYYYFVDITASALAHEKKGKRFPNRIDLFAQTARINLGKETQPIYVVSQQEKIFADEFLERRLKEKDRDKKLIAIHWRSRDYKRSWNDQRVKEFAHLLNQNGYIPLLFGWRENVEEWNISGSIPVFDHKIRNAAAILERCDLLVCPDSALLHLGGALNMKMVSLFGSMPPSCRINHYPNAVAVMNKELACLGCVYTPCPHHAVCMYTITAEMVLKAVENKLNDTKIIDSDHIVHYTQDKKVIRTTEL